MKKIKLIIVTISICVLFSSQIVSAGTLEENPILKNYREYAEESPSETFIDFYSTFYQNKEQFEIYDTDGNNITNSFYNDTYHFYEKADYMGLKSYILNNDIAGGKQRIQEVQETLPETRSFKTGSVSERYFYNVYEHPAAGELEYYIKGSYSWNLTTGKIASQSVASIDITRCEFGLAWSHATDHMTADSWISNDGYTAYFSGSFHLEVTLGFDIAGFPVGWTVDCGTYSGTASGTGH
ncbi:hypothetical protein H6A64_14785 [Lacrimispora saccharolytica]|nr:hypothetical protein [Lacrimispora saccharolytica]